MPAQNLGIAGKLAKHPRPELARFLHKFASSRELLGIYSTLCMLHKFSRLCGFQGLKPADFRVRSFNFSLPSYLLKINSWRTLS